MSMVVSIRVLRSCTVDPCRACDRRYHLPGRLAETVGLAILYAQSVGSGDVVTRHGTTDDESSYVLIAFVHCLVRVHGPVSVTNKHIHAQCCRTHAAAFHTDDQLSLEDLAAGDRHPARKPSHHRALRHDRARLALASRCSLLERL